MAITEAERAEIWADAWVAGFEEGAGRAPTDDEVKEASLTDEQIGARVAALVNEPAKS